MDEEDQLSCLVGPDHLSHQQIFESKNPLKVMITRHPLERLASAYNHLFRTGIDDFVSFLCVTGPKCEVTQNAYLARQIIEKLRPGNVHEESKSPLSFSEFVTYVVDSGQQFGDLKAEMEGKYPGIGAHWIPFHR